jgi:hypothetical protein
VGDEVMRDLWYTPGFLEAARKKLSVTEAELSALRKQLKWSGRVPSTEWIAKAVDEQRIYQYLHSATSRSLHFSAGEIFRRGWGDPHGIVTTDKPEFRVHLSEFALDKLWRLLFETVAGAMPLISNVKSSLAIVYNAPALAISHKVSVHRENGLGSGFRRTLIQCSIYQLRENIE